MNTHIGFEHKDGRIVIVQYLDIIDINTIAFITKRIEGIGPEDFLKFLARSKSAKRGK